MVLFDENYLDSPHTRREFNYAVLRDQITQNRDHIKTLLIYYYFDDIPFSTNEYSFYPSKCNVDEFVSYAIKYIKSKIKNVPIKSSEIAIRNKEILIDMSYVNTISHIKSFDEIMEAVKHNKSVLIEGVNGSGKTTLVKNFLSIYQKMYSNNCFIVYHEFDDSIENVDEIYVNLLRAINATVQDDYLEPNLSNMDENDIKHQIVHKLKRVNENKEQQLLLVLDNVHKLLLMSITGLEFVKSLIEVQKCILVYTTNKINKTFELYSKNLHRISNNIMWEQEYLKYSFNLSLENRETIINLVGQNIKYISILESLVNKKIISLNELSVLKSMHDLLELINFKNPTISIVLTIIHVVYAISVIQLECILDQLNIGTTRDELEVLIDSHLIVNNNGLYISHDSVSHLVTRFIENNKDSFYLDKIHELKLYFSEDQTYYDSLYKICLLSNDLNFFRSYMTKYADFLLLANRYNALIKFYTDFIRYNNLFYYLELRALNVILEACFKTLNLNVAQDVLDKTHLYSNTLNLYKIKLHIQQYQYRTALELLSKELETNFTFEKISIYFILKMHMRDDKELLKKYRHLIDYDFRVQNHLQFNFIEDKHYYLNLRNTAHLHLNRNTAIDSLILAKNFFSSAENKDEFLLATCQNNLGIAYLYKYLETNNEKYLTLSNNELLAAEEYMQDNSVEVYQSKFNLYIVGYFADKDKTNFGLLNSKFNKIIRLLECTNLYYDKMKFDVTHTIIKYIYKVINKQDTIQALKRT